jgi:hypothetical protein
MIVTLCRRKMPITLIYIGFLQKLLYLQRNPCMFVKILSIFPEDGSKLNRNMSQ